HQKDCLMRARILAGVAVIAAWATFPMTHVSAQVLIWSLPKEDGTWVRFEGAYKQTRARPNANAGDEMLEWRSELTISAVGSETADVKVFENGREVTKNVACRWVEFKSNTRPGGVDVVPGPGDVFVYKVLIPADRVIGSTADRDGIPVTFLPIVKGWRKVAQREAEADPQKAS